MNYSDYEKFQEAYSYLNKKLTETQSVDVMEYAETVEKAKETLEQYRLEVFGSTYADLVNTPNLTAKEKLDVMDKLQDLMQNIQETDTEKTAGSIYIDKAYGSIAAELARDITAQIDPARTAPVYYQDENGHEIEGKGAVLKNDTVVSIVCSPADLEINRIEMEINIVDPGTNEYENYYIDPNSWTDRSNAEDFMRLLAKAEMAQATVYDHDYSLQIDLQPGDAEIEEAEKHAAVSTEFFHDSEKLFNTKVNADIAFTEAARFYAEDAISKGKDLYLATDVIDPVLYFNMIPNTETAETELQQKICSSFLSDVRQILNDERIEDKETAIEQRFNVMERQMFFFNGMDPLADNNWQKDMWIDTDVYKALHDMVLKDDPYQMPGERFTSFVNNVIEQISDEKEHDITNYKGRADRNLSPTDRTAEIYVVSVETGSAYYNKAANSHDEYYDNGRTPVVATTNPEKANRLDALIHMYSEYKWMEMEAERSDNLHLITTSEVETVQVYGSQEMKDYPMELVFGRADDQPGGVLWDMYAAYVGDSMKYEQKIANNIELDIDIHTTPIHHGEFYLGKAGDPALSELFNGRIPADIDECISEAGKRCMEMAHAFEGPNYEAVAQRITELADIERETRENDNITL